MASLTKEELRAALTNHGIELPTSSAKKEELVALYEEFVQPLDQSKGEFSSDDEEIIITKKKSSRKAATPVKSATPAKSADKSQIILEEVVSDTIDDLSKLSDDELAVRLRQHGIEVGPIVDSTRAIYEKKLARVLGTASANNSVLNGSSEEAPVESNGSGLKNGEFSADEEATEDDDEQPSIVVRKAATPLRRSARTSSKASPGPASPSSDVGTTLRQRFGGDLNNSARGDRFTPTPRRSIHSYKITETTTETVVKSPDGKVSRDFEYRKETSESTGETGGAKSSVFSILTKLFFVLILVGVAFYVFTTYGDQLGLESLTGPAAVEAPAEPVEQAPEAVAVEEAPAQSAIGDI